MNQNNAQTTEADQLAMDRKRLALMQWGVVVAIATAVTAAVVPFATQAAADDAARMASWDAKHAETQKQITLLLTKTTALETTQRYFQTDLEEVKANVKAIEANVKAIKGNVRAIEANVRAIEADVQDIRTEVAENSATLQSILTLLANRLPERPR